MYGEWQISGKERVRHRHDILVSAAYTAARQAPVLYVPLVVHPLESKRVDFMSGLAVASN